MNGNQVVYNYGSQPVGNYGYISFVRHLAPVLPADDQVFLHNNGTEWHNNHDQIPLELFRNVCHWKSPRRFNDVLQNTAEQVNQQWRSALQELNNPTYEEESIRDAFGQLIQLDGVEVPTASALLTAWNPAEFGILDYKVLQVLNLPQYPSIRNYLAYRQRLLDLRAQYEELNNCALRQIELALWHYYSISKTGQKSRPDPD